MTVIFGILRIKIMRFQNIRYFRTFITTDFQDTGCAFESPTSAFHILLSGSYFLWRN